MSALISHVDVVALYQEDKVRTRTAQMVNLQVVSG
jgi:hypothetical protein